MKVEARDIKRWIKKGYALVGGAVLLNVFARRFEIATWNQVILAIFDDPVNIVSILLNLKITSLAFIFLVYPVVLGLLLEEIDKRIRK